MNDECYVTDTLKEVLKDMLSESDYYFVLAEIESAYDEGYELGSYEKVNR